MGDKVLMGGGGGLMKRDTDLIRGELTLIDYIISESTVIVDDPTLVISTAVALIFQ